jgi:transposase-like protein
MEEEIGREYVRRTSKNYSMSFKLQVVQEVERGSISATEASKRYGIQGSHTVVCWIRKYGSFDWDNQTLLNMPKSKDQKLLELEQRVKLLEKQKAFLEKQVENADKKAIFFDMMIDMAEKEFRIPIRKNSLPGQSTDSEKKEEKQ